ERDSVGLVERGTPRRVLSVWEVSPLWSASSPDFGRTPRPAGRGSLFARSGHPVLTRAQDIHVLLAATPRPSGHGFTGPVDSALRCQSRWSSGSGFFDDRCHDRKRPMAVTVRGLRIAAHGCAAAASQPWMADRA